MYCKQAECCEISYKDIGCFKDNGQVPRPLPELLFTDRDPKDVVYSGIPVHGQDFDAYVTDLVCRCAAATREKKYTHFAIQEYGECLSGPGVRKTYNQQGKETAFRFRPDTKPWVGCMDTDYKQCKQPSSTCIGQELTNFVYGLENVTAIDGNYTEWSKWSECSTTCGEGQQSRSRECINPKPQFGGRNCSHIGGSEESRPCSIVSCQVPAHWKQWSNWTVCSASCGEGMRQRTRECETTGSAGESNCLGPNSETEICENAPCPVNCSWSEWSQWSRCSVSCGEGVQNRHRGPDDPPAMFGGSECQGPSNDIQECSTGIQCPIDGNYTMWSTWSSCSRTCGGGVKSRNRTCTDPAPSMGGKDCSELGPDVQTKECGTAPCSQNGNYSDWSEWTSCDRTCGLGVQMRLRKCDNPPPLNGGTNCSLLGPALDYRECNISHCPIDGNFTEWAEWSSCSKTCGSGWLYRSRTCSNPIPQFGGKFCVGNDTESRPCNQGPCCKIPYKDIGCFADKSSLAVQKPLPELLFDDKSGIDTANWDNYIEEVICLCANAAFAKQYTHFSIQSITKCYSGPNVAKTYDKDGKSGSCIGRGGNPSGGKYETCHSPDLVCVGKDQANYVYGLSNVTAINGNYTDWSSWTDCSTACGPGVRSRYRSCTNPPPAFGGKDCSYIGDADQEQPCEIKKCPINGGMSEWTNWTECSPDCGEGKSLRFRLCNSPKPAYGGANCSGAFMEERDCHLPPCPVNGNYTEWGEFSSCVPKCGNGTQIRQRACTNPRPAHGGETCLEQGLGDDTEERPCNNGPCQQDGNWCEWSPWSLCSKTCGQGSRNRTRDCACPKAENGGKVCPGSDLELKACNLVGCPVNGNYTQWTMWTACDKSCGNGTRTRSRTCSNPAPAFGGKTCLDQGLGDDTEDEECFLVHCQVNGNFSEWSPWTQCSKTCGDGLQTRSRSCDNPTPKYGGLSCTGDTNQNRYCKMGECCDVSYKDLGCFADKGGSNRPLPEMLFSDEAKRKAESWDEFLPDLICSCAKAAKEKNYKFFGIQNFAECWSGSNAKDTYQKDGASHSCIKTERLLNATNVTKMGEKYEACPKDNLVCAGKLGANYVYGLDNVTVMDGNYTEWSPWGNCSATCGGGLKQRQRTCTNPKPGYGGKDCAAIGSDTDSAVCNLNPCPVDGDWGGWGQWTQCSVSCGNGTVSRTRACDSPPPQHGGDPCFNEASFEQVMPCFAGHCPVDGKCLNWGSWSPCSVTCGVGNKTRNRNCTEPKHGGKECICSKKDSESCKVMDCPVNGNWGSWSPWTSCSVMCGAGMKNRSRECNAPEPKFGGHSCNGSKTETTSCSEAPCPVDGNYTDWSAWDECSVLCGGGIRQRNRFCTNPAPQHNGKDCSAIGPASESQNCNESPCPQNGGFTEWSPWSSCSASCGEGTENSTRSCSNPVPKFNGTACVGDKVRSRACKIQDCCKTPYKRIGCFADKGASKTRPLPELLFDVSSNASQLVGSQWNYYLLEIVCKCAEEAKQRKYTHFGVQEYGKCYSGPDVKGTYNRDGPSTECVATSPEGSVKTESNSHLKCTPSDAHCAGKAGANFIYGLEYPAVNGNYTEWTNWEPCSRTCDVGTTSRTRSCSNPAPAFGGMNCSALGYDIEVKPCQDMPCPVNANWGSWSPLSPCSKTCGNGTMTKSRKCNNPAPSNGGLPCQGNATMAVLCNLQECPRDGGWSLWTKWSPCSKSCGEGETQRSRQCDNPVPNEFGKQCEGNATDASTCNLDPCYGVLTPWGEWNPCSHSCGDGTRTRQRTCEGADVCAGDLTETEACNVQNCPPSCDKSFDIGFIHDVSGGSKTANFELAKKFILSLVSTFTISQTNTRTSYLAFSAKPDEHLAAFNLHNTYTDFEKNIKTSIQGGYSMISAGLSKANNSMFTTENGDRPEFPDILVILTDGEQTLEASKEYSTIEETSNALKKRGITVMTVVIGKEGSTKNETFSKIASKQEYNFGVGSYNDLYKLVYNVSTSLCAVEGGKWSEWSSWTGCTVTCGNGTRGRMRYCQGGIVGSAGCTGNTTETVVCNKNPCIVPTTVPTPFKCSAAMDVALVIDSSSSITAHWNSLKEFLTSVIDAFTIGKDGTLVAIVEYSTEPRKIFGFDPLKTKEFLKLDIKSLHQLGGGTRIDKALRFTAEHVFGIDKGDRRHVPDLAVVFTDGKSDPGSEPLHQASQPLREKGIHVVSVGLGDDIDVKELKAMATFKETGPFLIKDLNSLVNYITSLAKEICKVPQRPKPGRIYTGYSCQPSLLYSFDKMCDQTVYDESGRGNNGQLHASVIVGQDPTSSKCSNFMQMSERGGVKIDGSNFRNKPSTAITIATWANPYSLSDQGAVQQVFVAKNSKNQAQISFQFLTKARIHVQIANGNETIFSVTTVPNKVTYFSWSHVAFSIDIVTKKYTIFVNGAALANSDIEESKTDGPKFFSMEWVGLTAIGFDDLLAPKYQYIGMIDEFYMFPCVLNARDIAAIQKHCGEYFPFSGAFTGANYKVYGGVKSSDLSTLQSEITSSTPVFANIIKEGRAPPFAKISPMFKAPVNDGAFAASISGYFVPPLTGKYNFIIEGHFQAKLSFSIEKKSIQNGIETQASFDGDTAAIKNATVAVNLQAGTFYYYEVLQLSSDQLNTLSFNFTMTCPSGSEICTSKPIESSYLQYKIPHNCSELAAAYENLPDDEYMIRMSPPCDAVSIYCDNMQSYNQQLRGLEYLTLPAGANENFAMYYRPRLQNYSSCSGPEIATPMETIAYWGQSWFKKVRVIPKSMQVDTKDFTHATSVGRQIEYGHAGDCYSNSKEDCRKGQFKINLDGTNMKLDGNPQWKATGKPEDDFRITQFTISPEGNVVKAKCGGSCSECMPVDHLRLRPEICYINLQQQQQPAIPSSPWGGPIKSRRSITEKSLKRDKKHTKGNRWWRWWPF